MYAVSWYDLDLTFDLAVVALKIESLVWSISWKPLRSCPGYILAFVSCIKLILVWDIGWEV